MVEQLCRVGEEWKLAKVQTLKQSVVMLMSHRTLTAFEVASKFLEDDDGAEMFGNMEIGTQIWKQRQQPVYVWFGRFSAHMYPGHGLALAALAYDMHCSPSPPSRYVVLLFNCGYNVFVHQSTFELRKRRNFVTKLGLWEGLIL